MENTRRRNKYSVLTPCCSFECNHCMRYLSVIRTPGVPWNEGCVPWYTVGYFRVYRGEVYMISHTHTHVWFAGAPQTWFWSPNHSHGEPGSHSDGGPQSCVTWSGSAWGGTGTSNSCNVVQASLWYQTCPTIMTRLISVVCSVSCLKCTIYADTEAVLAMPFNAGWGADGTGCEAAMQGLQDPGGLVNLFFPCILLYLSCATVLRTKVNWLRS